MRRGLRLTGAGLAVILFAAFVPRSEGQFPVGLGFRGPGAAPTAPGVPGVAAAPGYGNAYRGGFGFAGGAGYGGGGPYVGVFAPYQNGYGYGGLSAAAIASVPSAAYLNLGNTTYTTESPLPIYNGPRPHYTPLPPPTPMTALLKVQVPLDAEVWLEGQKMRSTGALRHFRSPPLDPTKGYLYEVRARWQFDGKPVEDVRHVAIRAGAVVPIDFTHLDPLVPRPSQAAPTPKPPPASPGDAADTDRPAR